MSYAIRSSGQLGETVRRVARDQIERALNEIDDATLPRHQAVHQVRKRCKKLRALLRLARPALGDAYRDQNARLRDIARILAGARDAQTVVDAFEVLVEVEGGHVAPAVIGSIRGRLEGRCNHLQACRQACRQGRQAAPECALARCRGTLEEVWLRIDAWPVGKADAADLTRGFERTYRQGRRRLEAARRAPTTANLHEWRKAVKYHWYQLRLVRPLWPEVLGAQARAARDLAEHLGEDHDLAVFHDVLLLEPRLAGDDTALHWLLGAIDRRRQVLLHTVLAEGALVYAERPGALRRRLDAYRRASSGAGR